MLKTLICTGFHRSATSVTAHYLQKAGLNMGYELMGGNISNPNGHYEDWPVVRLHDRQLSKNHTNWQYHKKNSLQTEPNFLSDYITQRNRHDQHWGVKDPRACLFLDDWHQSLGEHGNYLFIARHWSSCIESLLHRHSREFAHKLEPLDSDHVTLQFWIDPELAAKMWIAYNRRIIEFVQNQPDRTLIFTQRALFNHAPIITRVNEKFGFNLNTEIQSPYDPKLLNDSASIRIRQSLSVSVIEELNHLWQQLLAYSDATHCDETPIEYLPVPIPDSFAAHYQEAINEECKKVSHAHNNQNFEEQHKTLCYPENHCAKEISEWLNTIPLPVANSSNLTKIEHFVDLHQPTNGNVWIGLGKLALRAKQYSHALNAFKTAITLGSYAPFLSLHLGQIYQHLQDLTKASYFYHKAIQDNPKNPQFYVSLAQFLVSRNHTQDAKKCLDQGIKNVGYLPVLVTKYVDLLLSENQLEKAQQILKGCTSIENPFINELQIRLALQREYESGLKHYKDSVRKKVQEADRVNWLAQTGLSLSNASAENDLLTRCYQHWLQLNIDF